MDGRRLARAIENERHRRLLQRVEATRRRHRLFMRVVRLFVAVATVSLVALAFLMGT